MKKAFIVTDLMFGDSGKGTITDYLAKTHDASLVVKFNGGSQAAHNVVLPNGTHFTFSQFGSGSFQGANTYLSEYVSVDPLAMLAEGDALSGIMDTNAFTLMGVNAKCPIITPYHKAYNRALEEHRGDSRHGSCGVGHGICVEMQKDGTAPTLYFGELRSSSIVWRKLREICEHLVKKAWSSGFSISGLDHYEINNDFKKLYDLVTEVYNPNPMLNNCQTVIFEGAQGALLDEWHGFNPHTTWSTTTRKNADSIIKKYTQEFGLINDEVKVHNYGVMRTYMTRHGAGPFPSETKEPMKGWIFDDHNSTGDWQGTFRTGFLDLPLLKYALSFAGVNSIALTHWDTMSAYFSYVKSYEDGDTFLKRNGTPNLFQSEDMMWHLKDSKPVYTQYKGNIRELIDDQFPDTPVSIISSGQTWEDKIEV